MLSLPEILLLFALHDDRGTVHPAAFMAIDHGLRGAVLAELRLRKIVQTRKGGEVRRHPDRWAPTLWPLLDRAIEVLSSAPSPGTIADWLDLLQKKLPHLRQDLTDQLEAHGILAETDKERVLLPGSITHPMRDGSAEAEMLARIREAAHAGAEVSPRIGTLISLVSACNLVDVLFEKADRGRARQQAAWVAERDGISQAVAKAVAKAEGTW